MKKDTSSPSSQSSPSIFYKLMDTVYNAVKPTQSNTKPKFERWWMYRNE